MAGTLFVVGTPIGNLEDLTFRALRVLREVDLIAAEDTRRTLKLLAHYEIRKPMVSLREHNERRETPRLVARLAAGQSIALVSDAGTPGISDPGAALVSAARASGLVVTPIPGPSAVTAALSASGFPASEFVFFGFPPHGAGRQRTWFARLAAEPRTVVFFEAPHRIRDTIGHLTAVAPTRKVVVFRELTKLNEQAIALELVSLTGDELREQGEFVLVLAPLEDEPQKAERDEEIASLVGHLTAGMPVGTDIAVRIAACLLNERESLVANVIRRRSILAKRQSSSRA